MRWFGRKAAIIAIAVSMSFASVHRPKAEPASGSIPRFLLFSGADLWGHGASAHGGLVWSPQGLGRDGFTLKLLGVGGGYQYEARTSDITGRFVVGSILPGWRFKARTFEVTLFAGLDLQNHRLSSPDPDNRVQGTRAGLRTGLEVWSEPAATTMINGAASLSTSNASYWSRVGFGWRAFDRVWIGPEITALGDNHHHQLRAGLHVTGYKTENFEWTAGGGLVESKTHGGLYGRINVIARR